MGPDVQTDLWGGQSAAPAFSPFALPQAQAATPSLWSHAAVSGQHVAPPADPAPGAEAPTQVKNPRPMSSLWDGAKGLGSKAYRGLTAWNFEGRDANNGKAPTQAEIDQDRSWRQLGHKESIYHDNNKGAPERKYVKDDPDSLLGLGGKEAVIDGDTGKAMAAGPYQATYNYCNPAAGGIADRSPRGIARNVGHVLADVVPYWFGGTVRGDEGTNFAQRMLGPENYNKVGEKWSGAKNWAGGKLSSVGKGISTGLHGLTGWAGAKTHKAEPQHEH